MPDRHTGPPDLRDLARTVRDVLNRAQHLSHAARVHLVEAERSVNLAEEQARADDRVAEEHRRAIARVP